MPFRFITHWLLLALSLPSCALRVDADGYGGSDPVITLVLQARDAIVRALQALDEAQTQLLIGRLAACDKSPRPCRIAGETQYEEALDAALRDRALRTRLMTALLQATFVIEPNVVVDGEE